MKSTQTLNLVKAACLALVIGLGASVWSSSMAKFNPIPQRSVYLQPYD